MKDTGLIECPICLFSTNKGRRAFNIHLSKSPKGCRAKIVELRTRFEESSQDAVLPNIELNDASRHSQVKLTIL